MGKYSLIVVAGLVFTFGYIASNLNQIGEYFSDDLVAHYERAEARLAANSAAHMALAVLADSSTWPMDLVSLDEVIKRVLDRRYG